MTAATTLHPPGPPSGPRATGDDQGGPEPNTLVVANPALRGGFVQLPVAVLEAKGLSRDAKLLYAILLRYAWQAGSCFPGYDRLQADMDCSVNSLTRYMVELERSGLISRRRRGLGKTTIYTLHDPTAPAGPGATGTLRAPQGDARPVAPPPTPPQSHKFCDSGVARLGTPAPQKLRPESDSGERDSEEHHHSAPRAPSTLAPTPSDSEGATGAVDDDALLELLISHGITRRIARQLVTTYPEAAIRQQLDWHRYRPAASNPAGALVEAIRESWPAPPAWLDAQEHAAAVARQAEAEARRRAEEERARRAWEAKPPEERVQGRLQFWLTGQRVKGYQPTEAEIAAKRAELLAELGTSAAAGPGSVS